MQNNNSSNLSILQQLDEEAAQLLTPVTVYMALIMITGIVGNGLVCYVHGTKMKKSTANSFILWLAVLDLLTGVIGMPLEIYDLVRHYTFDNPAMCKVMRLVVYLTTMASVVTLIFIAVDRYCKICRPLKPIPVRRCRVVVCISLTTGVVFSSPSLVLFGRKRIPTPHPGIYGVDCSMDDNMVGTFFPRLYLSVLVFAFLVGLIILAVLYSLIGCHVYRRSRLVIGESIHASMLKKKDRNRKQNVVQAKYSADRPQNRPKHCDSRYKLGRTGVIFFTITLAFILSFLPSLALMTTRTVHKTYAASLSNSEYVFYSFGLRTYFINNAINPVLYGIFNGIFRKECVKLWQDCKLLFSTGTLQGAKLDVSRRKSNSESATEESLTPK